MDPTFTSSSSPLVSVVTTLLYPRHQPLACLASWTRGQEFPEDEIELVVVSNGRRRALERQVRGILRPADRLLRVDSTNEMALYDAGARAARGRWILFTEPHCVADSRCVRELVACVTGQGLAGACVRTLPTQERSRVARLEARMYLEDADTWTRDDDWRKFTKRGVILSKAAYEDVGGFEVEYRRFSEMTLAAALHARGYRLGYAPLAVITHYNSTNLAELVGYVWEYRREERRWLQRQTRPMGEADGSDGDPDLAEAAGVPGIRAMLFGVLGPPLGWSMTHVRSPGARALLGELTRIAAVCAAGPRAARGWRTGRAAGRFASTWLRFHLSGRDDDQRFARYKRLWQASGDLSIAVFNEQSVMRRVAAMPPTGVVDMATIPATHLAGFHALETWKGAAFRWTGAMAVLRFERLAAMPTVTLVLLPVRAVGEDSLFVYWNGTRLLCQPGRSTPERLVFEPVPDRRPDATTAIDTLVLVCAPLASDRAADPRVLGLPLVSIAVEALHS